MPFMRNKRTGEVIEVDGSGRPVGQAGPPQDPTFPYQGAKARTDIVQGQTSAAKTSAEIPKVQADTTGQLIDNDVKRRTSPAIIAKAAADARQAEANARASERASSVLTDDQRKAKMQGANLDALVGQINRTQALFNSSQGGQGLDIGSPAEYLPTSANKQFDTAAAGLAEQGLAAFRVPGVGAQSDTELRQFVEANKPSSWSQDSSNAERLRQLRARTDAARKGLGLPRAQWEGQYNNLSPADADSALAKGYRDLAKYMQGKSPAQRQAMMRAFEANPQMQQLRQMSPSMNGRRGNSEDDALLRKYGIK